MAKLGRSLRLVFGLALSVLTAGCRRDRAVDDRPRLPTLTVEPDQGAPASGRRVVAAGQIAQPWHVGAWSPASITLRAVAAGDAILVVGAYWGDRPRGASTAPTDDRGTLRVVVDQGPRLVGRTKPPVFAQLYLELDAAPGPHTITPPALGGPAGDGTLYVVQIRGLTEHRLVASGETWATGAAITSVSVALAGVASPGDLVIARGAFDNTAPRDGAGWSSPSGWQPLGVQDDAASNVPSALGHRLAAVADVQAVTWTWTDPTANVVTAVIAALR